MLAHGGEKLGIEPIRQRECFGQHPTIDRQVEVVDRFSETLENTAELPRHDR